MQAEQLAKQALQASLTEAQQVQPDSGSANGTSAAEDLQGELDIMREALEVREAARPCTIQLHGIDTAHRGSAAAGACMSAAQFHSSSVQFHSRRNFVGSSPWLADIALLARLI